MSDFDLLIFDCDGVLVDSEVLSCRCLVDVLGRYGVRVGLDEVFDRFLGRSFSVVEEYCRVVGVSLPERFQPDLLAHLTSSFKASLRLMPHVRSLLDSIDYSYCLASSSDRDRISMTLSIAGLGDYFGDRIYSGSMVARGKPAPDLFLHAADRMGVMPERCVVVEDSLPGVAACVAAGMTAIGFTGGSHCPPGHDSRLAKEGATLVIDQMAQLAPALAHQWT